MASFTASVSNVTETTADFYAKFTGGASNYLHKRVVEIWLTGKSPIYIWSDEIGGADSTFSATITGLIENTHYDWIATLGYSDGPGADGTWDNGGNIAGFTSYKVTDDFWTSSGAKGWDWTASNGQATAIQTQNAYSVLFGYLPASGNFSHLVWNDIVNKVAEVLSKKGLSWSGSYASQSATLANAGDTLSAIRYNSVKYNIERLASTGYPYVGVGDKLTGGHINALTNAINNAI